MQIVDCIKQKTLDAYFLKNIIGGCHTTLGLIIDETLLFVRTCLIDKLRSGNQAQRASTPPCSFVFEDFPAAGHVR